MSDQQGVERIELPPTGAYFAPLPDHDGRWALYRFDGTQVPGWNWPEDTARVLAETLRARPEPPPVGIIDAETCEHVWRIWPETDGKSQRCTRCGDWRDTPQAATGQVTGEMGEEWRAIREALTNALKARAFAAHHQGSDPNKANVNETFRLFDLADDAETKVVRLIRSAISRAPAQAPAVPEYLRRIIDATEPGDPDARREAEEWVRSLLADAAKNREGGQHGRGDEAER